MGRLVDVKNQVGFRAALVVDTKQEIVDRTRDFMYEKTSSIETHKEDGKI
ncbi:MAG: hypothetical protein ACJA2Q_001573 [Pseudohongiellaceae bacterium]|jgi:hypothetical protein